MRKGCVTVDASSTLKPPGICSTRQGGGKRRDVMGSLPQSSPRLCRMAKRRCWRQKAITGPEPSQLIAVESSVAPERPKPQLTLRRPVRQGTLRTSPRSPALPQQVGLLFAPSEIEAAAPDSESGNCDGLGASPLAVADCRNQFEAAAAWYRADCRSSRRVPPSTIKRQANGIAAAAKRLLRHLEIYDSCNAAEGPRDVALLEALALADDGIEENVIGASERVARLVAIFEGIAAAQELERRGRQAATDAATIGKLTTLHGRQGNPALRAWIAEMMPIYKKLTGKEPRVSIDDRGKATGPFWRFLEAVSQPLDIDKEELASGVREKTRASVRRASLQK